MPGCCVPRCTNRSETDPYLSFHRFPADAGKRKQWLKMIRREDFAPSPSTRVCSWHFPDGLDGGPPSRFQWNVRKRMAFPSPDTTPKRRKMSHTCTSTTTTTTSTTTTTTSDTPDDLPDPVECKQPAATGSDVVLHIENHMLREEVKQLKSELSSLKLQFSFRHIENDNEKIAFYTGLPDRDTFLALFAILEPFEITYHSNWSVQKLSLQDQLLMTLMKLRLNLGHTDLATRFNCSRSTVTNVFISIVCALYDILFTGLMCGNLPSRAKCQASLPACFHAFPNCRLVLDCTEISVAKPEKLDEQCAVYSNYKGKTTLKTLIGVAPNGIITFVSDLYGGSTSDKAITKDCGVLDQLDSGDMILADKGFTIRDILPQGVTLNIPAFLTKGQFTQEEVVNNKQISQARIHVERAIQRLKSFDILDHIPYQYKFISTKLVRVCACLNNLQSSIMREVESLHTF